MKRQLYYLQCHHTSLLLNFYTKFPKLFETFKIFLKTFIKAILIKVSFIIENLPNWTNHKLFAYYQNTASIGFTNFKMWISNFDSFFFATNLWITHWSFKMWLKMNKPILFQQKKIQDSQCIFQSSSGQWLPNTDQ